MTIMHFLSVLMEFKMHQFICNDFTKRRHFFCLFRLLRWKCVSIVLLPVHVYTLLSFHRSLFQSLCGVCARCILINLMENKSENIAPANEFDLCQDKFYELLTTFFNQWKLKEKWMGKQFQKKTTSKIMLLRKFRKICFP